MRGIFISYLGITMEQSTLRKGHSLFFPLFIFVIINLIVFSLSRLSLGLWQAERVNAVDGWSQLMLQGFRIDVSALCCLFGLPALFSVLLLSNNVIGKIFANKTVEKCTKHILFEIPVIY